MKKILTISLILSVVFTPFITKVVNAAPLTRTFNRDYTIVDDYVQVKESKTLQFNDYGLRIPAGSEEEFTIFNPIDVDVDRPTKIQKTKDSIRLTDSDGRNLTYNAVDTATGNLAIQFSFPRDITYFNPYTVTLEYNSYGLLIESGNIRDVYVPAFSEDYAFTGEQYEELVNTRVIIPKTLGNINFALPKYSQTESGDNYVITFNREDLVGQTAWIQVGTKQFYSFLLKQEYIETSPIGFTQNTYKVLIPRSTNAGVIKQKVYFTKISPAPYAVEEDELGNLFAEFRVPSNESGEIVIEGYAELDQDNSIDFKNSGKLSDIEQSIISENTSSAEFWESDSDEIKEAVAEIFAGKDVNNMTIYEISQAVYTFVTDKIDYSNVKRFGINERKGALATLKGGAAVCMEYSDLYIALMRAAGVPARAAFGYGYSALDSSEAGAQTISHQWAEVYIPSIKSWVGVDTTWGENGNILIGGDLNHFYTHVANVSPNTPSTTEVRLLGGAVEIPERIANVDAVSSIPSEELLTPEDLVSKYPRPNSFDINNIPDATSTILKIVLALLITFIIVSPIYIKRNSRKKKPISDVY